MLIFVKFPTTCEGSVVVDTGRYSSCSWFSPKQVNPIKAGDPVFTSIFQGLFKNVVFRSVALDNI